MRRSLAYGEKPHEGDDDLGCYVCDSVEMRDESWFASIMYERLRASDRRADVGVADPVLRTTISDAATDTATVTLS